jgi:purine-nucleoside phosphorylase
LDFVIPNWSFGNDSVTRIYARDIEDFKHYFDKALSKSLKEKITLSNKIWEGPIITCQAMMGETWEDVQSWSKEGYHGVEMETSTVFSVSNSFKVPSASIMYISDNLIKGQTVGDDSHVAQKDIRELSKNEVYKVGILTLLN